MIRIHIDPKLQSVVNLFKEAYWWFTCLGISPLADHAAKAAIRRAELRRPSRPNRRIS
jgi:hypothetical protein